LAPTNYDTLAADFDRRYRENDYSGVEATLESFVAGADGPVLEVGCGTGYWLALLAGLGARIAGLDSSAAMLERARARLAGAALELGTAESLPFPTAAFARIYCINALHHFTNAAEFFSEARRVLGVGGKVLTVGLDPHTGLDRWCIYDYFPGTRAHDERRYPPSGRIRAWMRDAGFERQETFVAQHLPLRFPARAALSEGRLGRSVTSQLADLSDEAYGQGVRALEGAIREAEARGEVLEVEADLRLWATVGHRVA
jgi:ubiquinone/menaquinone biosynthesis C-methylase UbiE